MATSIAEIADDYEDDAQPERHPLARLQELARADNVADMLEDEELSLIGARAVREYEIDDASRQDWKNAHAEGLKLAMQVTETKNYPWPNAANVKYPLLTVAAMQFAARAYPAIVPGDQPVQAKVQGKDEDGNKRARADRVAEHMSFQLTEEMTEWEEDTDKLLHILPIAGLAYRKTYFSPTLGRNRSELVMPEKLVVNDSARDLDTVPRITQELEYYPQEVMERVRQGLWREIEMGRSTEEPDDEQAPQEFLEQHRLLDLDGDGFMEPWIVTVHKETRQVVRIKANFAEDSISLNMDGDVAKIEREQYFTKFPFLPNPSGGFHTIGFGYLLRPLNEAINTTLNQLLDAGRLANTGGGFIGSGARLRGGQVRFRLGEFVPVDVSGSTLKDNIVPLTFPGPSPVLFELLGMLVEAAKDITSVKDIMTGQEPRSGNTPASTVMAMIEQGMQVFSAIYKRIYRSLKSEYAKLYHLNALYLDEEQYYTLHDREAAKVGRGDYAESDLDIRPVADPRAVTNMQRLAKSQYLMEQRDDPFLDGIEIRRRALEAAGIDDIDDIVAKEAPKDPKMLQAADEIEIKKRELTLDEIELEGKLAKMRAETIKLLAEAEGVEPGQQMQAYIGLMQQLNERAKLAIQFEQANQQQPQD